MFEKICNDHSEINENISSISGILNH